MDSLALRKSFSDEELRNNLDDRFRVPSFSISLHEVSAKVIEAHEILHNKLVRKLRKAVTGHPDKKVSDSLHEESVRKKVKKIDAMSFSLGVSLCFFVELVFFSYPRWFPSLYVLLISSLLVLRFFTYRKEKYQFFMIDFCYFCQLIFVLFVFTCGGFGFDGKTNGFCQSWFQINYMLSHGPLAVAIITWSNSLVFHSIDKLTSFGIHILPALMNFIILWDETNQSLHHLSLVSGLLLPLFLYLLWQIGYLYIELVYLKDDLSLVTSYRYLIADKKNPVAQWIYRSWRRWGLMGNEVDVFDYKILSIFFIFQFIYILVTILFCFIFTYRFYFLSVVYLLTLNFAAIWNGANYYIQVFSQRYNSKFTHSAPVIQEVKMSSSSSKDQDKID
uniref:Glycerophosphocholine acyltransferase 1 n=1 Tax=Lepeophtheirus salmonis TaxID=72036 RepID=A0A0K2TPV9_LEPSM